MDLPRPLEPGRFVRRLNRFVAEVRVGERTARAHVANSGRLAELLVEGAEVRVQPVAAGHRATTHDLLLVRHRGTWVSIDSAAPARMAAEAFLRGGVSPIPRAEELRRAREAGVVVAAYRCRVTTRGIALEGQLEVEV